MPTRSSHVTNGLGGAGMKAPVGVGMLLVGLGVGLTTFLIARSQTASASGETPATHDVEALEGERDNLKEEVATLTGQLEKLEQELEQLKVGAVISNEHMRGTL